MVHGAYRRNGRPPLMASALALSVFLLALFTLHVHAQCSTCAPGTYAIQSNASSIITDIDGNSTTLACNATECIECPIGYLSDSLTFTIQQHALIQKANSYVHSVYLLVLFVCIC
jgi:hypothetical protein